MQEKSGIGMSQQSVEHSQRNRISLLVRNARFIASLAWNSSPALLVGVLCLNLLTALFPVIQVYIMRELINAVMVAQEQGNNSSQIMQVLGFFGAVLLAQLLFTSAYQFAQRLFQDKLRFKVSLDIMEHSALLDAQFFDSPSFQDKLEHTRGNIANQLSQFMGMTLDLISIGFEIFALLVLLLSIQPYVVFVTAVIVIPYFILNNQIAKISYRMEFMRVRRRRWMNYFTRLLMSYESVFEVRLLNLAPLLIQRYRETMKGFMSEDLSLFYRRLMANFAFGLAFMVLTLVLVYWVVSEVVKGILTIGDIAVYIGAFTRLRANLERMTYSSSQLLELVLFVDDLTNFLSLKPSQRAFAQEGLEPLRGEIRFEHVTFRYPENETEVLHDISLDIKAGELVAIVGKNGAGKSTLVKLLAGFYHPSEGEIYLDGQAMSQLNSKDVYKQITFVLQNFNKYETTVSENIAYGDWEKLLNHPEQVKQLAEDVEIVDFVEELPDGYETLVGRMFGVRDLSGGQWQKLSLARAFARDASIVILDEPASQLDPIAEHRLFEKFRELLRGRTAIVISHRLSSIEKLDRILVLDEGCIVESGSHSELIALNGEYAKLYRLQKDRAF
jgi:ATP-binding cassette subfamily B protein